MDQFLIHQRQPLRLWWFWFALACALVIFLCVMSLINLSQVQFKVSDKTLHFVAYCVLTLSWMQVLRGSKTCVAIVLAAIALGVGLEIAQSFHPMRHMDYRDAIANSIGAVLGYGLGWLGFSRVLVWLEPYLLRLIGRSNTSN